MKKSKKRAVLLVAFGIVTIGLLFLFAISKLNPLPQVIDHAIGRQSERFPEIDTDSLTARQLSIITLAKQEFEAQPSYTKYSEGVEEAWCADFVSWIYKQAGAPYSNPHSGSWRIPGTITLREYFTSLGRFKTDASYSPKVGDLMFYDNPSSFGQHVNIIAKIHTDGSVTTVGGNEAGKIRVLTHMRQQAPGFLGYGVLE